MNTLPKTSLQKLTGDQAERNRTLLAASVAIGERFRSDVLPFALDLEGGVLTGENDLALAALEKSAAAIAVKALASLATVGDLDHLGGGLELIPALLMTLGVVDYDRRHFTIEHGHTSIGYYSALAALGFLPEQRVIDGFRRSLDIAGHVSWVPGGTELSSGRLGVMVAVGTGQALGLRAHKGPGSLVICHCGDAGWISGQALDGFVAASLHHAPIVFVMHRNGIQLSGQTARIMNKDPRPIVSSLGIRVLEIPSLHDRRRLFQAYSEAYRLAQAGEPALIYPTGFRSTSGAPVTLASFGQMYGVSAELQAFAAKQNVGLQTEIWIPGSLMSFRDVYAMLQCLFYVNLLPGGVAHHDGGMKGRDASEVLSGPMLRLAPEESSALARLRSARPRVVVTSARPARGTPNLVLTREDVESIALPPTDKWVSARAGSEAAYVAVARKYPERCFFVSCDLNPSTKLGKASALVPPGHHFEMSIQEQVAALMTDGLSFSSREPQLNVVATFAAFFEGIAREGFELWRYQRNLTGFNEGLNLVMHLAHVGACTGRDHFSGWSLDWINLAFGYLPYLRRFYAPADARAAFLAVKDAASAMGGHIVAVSRDNLPVLTRAGTTDPLWNATDDWTPTTPFRQYDGATTAVLAVGAPSYLAGAAAEKASSAGVATDVYIVNGFPLDESFLPGLAGRYRRIVTIEDGLIGTVGSGLRGFAGHVASTLAGGGVQLEHLGIVDPQIAPSDHFVQVWEHYGMTEAKLTSTLLAGR